MRPFLNPAALAVELGFHSPTALRCQHGPAAIEAMLRLIKVQRVESGPRHRPVHRPLDERRHDLEPGFMGTVRIPTTEPVLVETHGISERHGILKQSRTASALSL